MTDRPRRRPTWTWTWAALVAAVLVVPPLAVGPIGLAALAAGAYLALAAVGLNFAVGLGGMPSLGQGAFVGLGAFGAAWLRVDAGWDPLAAAVGGAVLAAAGGIVSGAGLARLRPVLLAVSTWVLSWLFVATMAAFPAISGGGRGIALGEPVLVFEGVDRLVRFTPGVHYLVAVLLLAGGLVAYRRVARGPAGLALAAVRQGPAAAETLGLRAHRLRTGAFVASAGIGGLAGGLSVQLAGVADPGAYGPLLSAKLLIAVLIGGAGTTLGPVVGALVLLAVPPLAGGIGALAGIEAERFEPVVVGILLLAALLAGGRGILRRRSPRETDPAGDAAPGPVSPAVLRARDVARSFGGVRALEDVSLDVRPGEVHAVIGPNGSGKTTLLRILSGRIHPDRGRVLVGERDITGWGVAERLRAGIARTLQRTEVFDGLAAAEHVAAGATVRRRVGALRALFATPSARREATAVRAHARAVLRTLGVERLAGSEAGALDAADRRLLMLATAAASDPSIMLVDEPSAGMAPGEADAVVDMLRALRDRGLGVLVVEHNVALVAEVADRVTVLEAGRVIATGSVADVVGNPRVQEAYLGAVH